MMTRKRNGVTQYLTYVYMVGSRCETALWTTNRDEAWTTVPDHVRRAVRAMRIAR